MKRPDKLQRGDLVAIVATANKVEPSAIKFGVGLLKTWGLKVRIGKSISLKHYQFAGTDQERAADLQEQLDDPKVRAVWCARGGYGTVRILDLLDFTVFKKQPKWIIGYSDITALHAHLSTVNIASIHAEMPALIEDKTPETAALLRDALFGGKLNYSWNNNRFNCPGEAGGELVGGNLSVLYSLLGSPSSLELTGKILFLEELGEYLYHIDRMLQNLKRNNWFTQISGLVVGGLTEMNDNTTAFGQTAEEIIRETVKEYDFPVGFAFPAGHTPKNYPLILGESVHLSVNNTGGQLWFTA